MTTNLKEVTGNLTFDELKNVKLQINFTIKESDAIRYFKHGHVVGYYNPDTDESIIVDSVQTIKEVSSKGYELFEKKHFI